MKKNCSWLLPFQAEIRQFRSFNVLQKKKSIPGVWLPHLFPGWKPVTLFCISYQLIHNWFTFSCGAQTLHQIWFTIILLLSRDNVLCPITSFIHQVKKVESSTIHPLGCFKVMTKKLNCALVGFQCQLHTVQIQILIE